VGLFLAYGHHLGLGSADVIYDNSRFQGLTGNPNALGTNMMFVILGAIYLFRKSDKKIIKALMFVSILLAFLMIFQTGSRKFFIYSILLLLVVLVLEYHKPRQLLGIGIIATIIIIFGHDYIIQAYQQSVLFERLTNEAALGASADTRLSLQLGAFNTFIEHPIFGIGLYNLTVVQRDVAHGYVAEVLASGGIVAFLLLLTIYLKFGWKTVTQYFGKGNSEESLFALLCLVIFFLTSFGFHYYDSQIHWFLFSAVYAYLRKKERAII
jgi:O-antigen ligase